MSTEKELHQSHPEARNELKDLGGRTFPPPRSFRLGTRPQDDRRGGLILLAVFFLLSLAACAAAQPAAKDDRARITAIEDRIRAAFAAGDAEGVAAEYTEDALLLPQGAPVVSGRAAIADLYRAVFKDYRCELKTEIEEVEIAGDWAFVRGRLQSTVTPKAGGDPMVSQGKYIAIVRRGSDGVWRFARDIYNMDRPPGQS